MKERPNLDEVINDIQKMIDENQRSYIRYIHVGTLMDILYLLKEHEAREPHYTTLRYIVDGIEVTARHPECPKCIENGLRLWDAEIEKGQAYCKRCSQAVKWK